MYAINHLHTNIYDNEIHYDLTSEEIKEIKEAIEINDFGTLDVVIDFMNTDMIRKAIAEAPDHLSKKTLSAEIWHQYMCLELLNQLDQMGVKTNLVDLDHQNEIVFSGEFTQFEELQFTDFFLIDTYLKNKLSKRIRIHFFMENIADIELQECINQIFASRASSICIGYTTAEDLITYNTLNGQVLEAVHDYREFHNDEYYQKLETKRIALMRKIQAKK